MIGALAEDMQTVKSDIKVIKSALDRKVDYDEFDKSVPARSEKREVIDFTLHGRRRRTWHDINELSSCSR